MHHCKLVTILALAAAVVLLPTSFVLAENLPASAAEGTAVGPAEKPAETAAEEFATEEEAPPETPVETHNLARVFAGYRFVGTDASGGRAAEYDYLHSSAVGGLTVNSLGKDLKLAVEGGYLNDKDYHGDLLTDYRGEYRLHLRTESLFHNLDHEQLGPSTILGGPGVGATSFIFNANDLDPTGRYGIKVEQDLAQFRYKIHDYPIHINVGYWRMVKDGASQLRFADVAFETPDPNTVKAQSRRIDRETQEGNAGLDAHLGPLDLIYTFQVRQFRDNAGIPRDIFVFPRIFGGVTPVGTSQLQEHNEDPDSRFYSHTVKLHTSLTGGVVGAASYTYGRRENLSSLTGVSGANQTTNTLQNAAGDFSFTPCKWFSASLNYRRQEVSRDTPTTLVSSYAVSPNVAVRPAVDTQKDLALATLSLRLLNDHLTVKGEYKGEFQHRDNTQSWLFAGDSNMPEHSALHRGTLTLISRPTRRLRLKALYGYSVIDHPSYGNAFAEKHEGQLLATYALAKRAGLTASYRVTRESNDQISRPGLTTFPAFPLPPTALVVDGNPPRQFAREKRTSNTSVSLWVAPVERLTISGSYGLLWNKVEQGVLFSSLVSGSDAAASYSSRAQLYAINAVYQLNDRLDLSLALQQVRSLSRFDPAFKAVTIIPGWDTSGVKVISEARTVESSLSARGDYRLSKNSSCTVDYSYRDYDNENAAFFNGTVQTVMAYLTVKW